MTQTLRGLERDGLILRRVQSAVPPRVEYELTEMGQNVIPLLRELCHWAERNARSRDQARRRFDAAAKDRMELRGSAGPRDPLSS